MSSQQKTIYKCKFKTITLKIREKTPKYNVNSPEATFEFARKIYEQLDDDQEHCHCIVLKQ
ncbi:hypothetical protein BLFGPEAP_01109 [Candidatus Methanoperedenaceae archaeon GB50]|nr:hypothetical protein BLFGPEAP_01109 [Candidatus Methanoperedenaceae archaeon GB50]